MTDHLPGCPMRGMPWLDRAAADGRTALADRSAQRAMSDDPPPGTGPDEWTEIGLSAVLRRSAPQEQDQRLAWCTCAGAQPRGR